MVRVVASGDVMSRPKFFLLLSGFRFSHTEPQKRKSWYQYGPKLYPTLEGLEDGPAADVLLTLENVETHHAAFAEAHPQGDAASRSAEAWSAPAGILSVAAEAANDVQLGVVAPSQPQPSVTAAAAAAAAAEEPAAMELDDDPGAGIGATAAAAAAPALRTATAAAAAPALEAGPAAAAAAAGRQAGGARRPSPARARAGAGTRATAAPTVAAAVQASTAAPASSSAPAPLSAAPARPRQRQAQSASTVASVFDSIFGANDEQIAQAGAGDPVSSPTPSSGSEQGGGTPGPKTFRRPR